MLFVFFFKRKTAYEMRISDWSSDVCSSDLHRPARHVRPRLIGRLARLVATASAGALMFTLAPTLTSQAAAEEKLPPGRDLVPYTVKAGDTAPDRKSVV